MLKATLLILGMNALTGRSDLFIKAKRTPGNMKFLYWYYATYDDYPLMVDAPPFVEQYLEKLYQPMRNTLVGYTLVFAFRFGLRIPHG
ncbi:hypothetical protein EC919_110109 [Pseudomonas graminis]|nr:hypothetical protein EC919_110109 [Pseudomonas graminis]